MDTKLFKTARLKLTAWYLLIIMVISISFSAVIYKAQSVEIERFARIQRARIELRLNGFDPTSVLLIDPNLIEDTKRRLLLNLFLMNLAIFAISGFFGYFLAGLTLTPIKEMVDEQNRFISDASHEINTPLTSLKLAMEVFLRSKKKTLSESKTLIKESIDEVDKLQALSKSLLQLARFEVPNGNGKIETVDIKEIISEAIKKVAPMAMENEIKIEDNVESIKIRANRYTLVDLFVILLDNGIKYSAKNGLINIKSKLTRDSIEISVLDNGIGISKKDLHRVFDRFYRADLARNKKTDGGYGLGLSIAKKIVESHHGDIKVKSIPGKGSEFVVSLPKK